LWGGRFDTSSRCVTTRERAARFSQRRRSASTGASRTQRLSKARRRSAEPPSAASEIKWPSASRDSWPDSATVERGLARRGGRDETRAGRIQSHGDPIACPCRMGILRSADRRGTAHATDGGCADRPRHGRTGGLCRHFVVLLPPVRLHDSTADSVGISGSRGCSGRVAGRAIHREKLCYVREPARDLDPLCTDLHFNVRRGPDCGARAGGRPAQPDDGLIPKRRWGHTKAECPEFAPSSFQLRCYAAAASARGRRSGSSTYPGTTLRRGSLRWRNAISGTSRASILRGTSKAATRRIILKATG